MLIIQSRGLWPLDLIINSFHVLSYTSFWEFLQTNNSVKFKLIAIYLKHQDIPKVQTMQCKAFKKELIDSKALTLGWSHLHWQLWANLWVWNHWYLSLDTHWPLAFLKHSWCCNSHLSKPGPALDHYLQFVNSPHQFLLWFGHWFFSDLRFSQFLILWFGLIPIQSITDILLHGTGSFLVSSDCIWCISSQFAN